MYNKNHLYKFGSCSIQFHSCYELLYSIHRPLQKSFIQIWQLYHYKNHLYNWVLQKLFLLTFLHVWSFTVDFSAMVFFILCVFCASRVQWYLPIGFKFKHTSFLFCVSDSIRGEREALIPTLLPYIDDQDWCYFKFNLDHIYTIDWSRLAFCILHPPDMLRIRYTCYCHNRFR